MKSVKPNESLINSTQDAILRVKKGGSCGNTNTSEISEDLLILRRDFSQEGLMENWFRGMGYAEESRPYLEKARRVKSSFNWCF